MANNLHTHTISMDVGDWVLTEAEPAPDLADSIAMMWEGHGDLPSFTEKILPRPTVELMFNLGNPHRVLSIDGHACDEPYDCGWLSGMQQRFLTVHTPNGSHLISVSLKPLGAWRLLRLPMTDVTGQVPLISAIWGRRMDLMREQLLEAEGPAQRFERLESWIRKRLDFSRRIPAWLPHASQQLELSHGQVGIYELSRELGISRALLHRDFREHIGLAPKVYARMCRFHHLMTYPAESYGAWLDRAEQLGYYDDSHLYRDFRAITGSTPKQYWQQRSPDGTAMLI